MTAITLSVEQAAELLGISAMQVRRLVAKGVLPTVPHLGRVTRIPRVAIDELVASALPSSAGVPECTTAAGEGNGGTAPESSGKWAEARPSTSEKGDAAGGQPDGIENRAGSAAQKAG